jgi:hypothetical protein
VHCLLDADLSHDAVGYRPPGTPFGEVDARGKRLRQRPMIATVFLLFSSRIEVNSFHTVRNELRLSGRLIVILQMQSFSSTMKLSVLYVLRSASARPRSLEATMGKTAVTAITLSQSGAQRQASGKPKLKIRNGNTNGANVDE